MITLNVYNSKTYVNKGLSKSTRAKNIVAQKKKERQGETDIQTTTVNLSGAEKLLEIYGPRDIDMKDPNGYYLMNSGYRHKGKGGLGRIESTELSRLMSDLFQNETFVQLSQATTSPSEIMQRAVDLNEKLHASTAQKTKTFSSIYDLRESYDYFKKVRDNKGKIFIFDTETIGGKNRTGIWNPLAITEFAMQEYDFGTGETISTNIVMGLADNADNQRVYNEIIKYMEAENWQAIEQNEELFVTASRAGLYADAKMTFNPDKGYFEITELGDKKGDWKNIDKFKKGWENLQDAYKNTEVSALGIKKSDLAFYSSVAKMQNHLNYGNAMALGQNFQIFDEPVVNTQLKKTMQYYQEIINETTGKLGRIRGIDREQAQRAVNYMQDQLDFMGGGLNLPNQQTLDTLPFFRTAVDVFGANTVYNGNREMIKKAGGGLAKQEYIGEAWFPDLFASSMAHMADFDVTVLNYAATHKLEQTGGMTLLDYIATKMGDDGTGVLGIDDKARKIKTGQIYYSRAGTSSFDFAGKGLLNFTRNEKTGEIFTSAGYKYVNGQNLGYEKNKINMGTDLTKGSFYQLESVKKVKAADIHSELGNILPDMSGTEFVVAQFKMALPEGAQTNGLEHLSYNFIFNSEKQFSGFMSSNMNMAVDINEQGEQFIVDGMEDLFDYMIESADGLLIDPKESDFYGTSENQRRRIKETLESSMKNFQANKSYNSIINSDGSYKNIQKMMNARRFLDKQELENLTGEDLKNLIDGKSIRNLDEDKTQFLSKKLKDIMGFKNTKLGETVFYSNTQRNMVNAWEYIQSKDKFYGTVLKNLDEQAKIRNWNEDQKALAFSDLVETMRVQAAELISTGDSQQDKRRITGKKAAALNVEKLKNTYDIKLPNNFQIDTSSQVMKIDSFSSSDYRDIMRLNLDNSNEHFTLISKLRNAMYGSRKPLASTETLDRTAMTRFVHDVLSKDESFSGYMDGIRAITREEGYNVTEAATEIIKAMKGIKEGNVMSGILRELDVPSLFDDELMTQMLNSDTMLDLIGYNAKHNLINPVDTRSLLKNGGEGMKKFVKNDVMKFYMPDRNAFNATLEGLTDQQKYVKTKLYDTLYEDISAQLVDIFTIGSKIEGAEMSVSSTGDILFSRHGEAINIKGVPKVGINNGHLFGMVGNQELNLHLELGYTRNGIANIKTNLGDKFENSRYVSRNIIRKLEQGDFRIDDFLSYTNKLAEDFREEASYSGTSGELLSNYFVGTKELNRVLPEIFGSTSEFNLDILEALDMPEDLKAKLRKKYDNDLSRFKKGANIDELDPAFRQAIGPYRVNIMRTLANKMNAGDKELFEFISGLNFSTKDKSKAGKDILMGAGMRFHVGFTNAIDENSRPVIGGAGNVFYLDKENIKKAADNFAGIMGIDSLFESNETLYINKITKEVIDDATTTFTGRTAYVGEVGIRTILKNNFNRVMNDNTVGAGLKDKKEKIYNYLNSFVNTFEQAKVFSAEAFDTITGGNMAADKQVLSLSKDIHSAINLDDEEVIEKFNKLYSVKGKIIRAEDGTLAYVSSNGKIVKHGEAIIPYASYGGSQSNWVSKLQRGVLGYEITDREKNVLSDKNITNLLNKYSDLFEGIDSTNESLMNKRFEEVLRKEGLKANFIIEDINKTTLPKILINDAEKSMNHLGYMRIGTLNENIEGVLMAYGDDTKELIGTAVPTEKALRAYFDNEEKTKTVLKAFNFNSIEDFIEAVKEESYAADRMLFGKGGVFEGFVAIGNDNLLGHGNKGSMLTGAVNEAINMLGKYDNGGIESTASRQMGLEHFIKLVNENEDFRFFKSSTGQGYKFKLVDGHLMLENGQELEQGLNNADVVDIKRMEDLFEHINNLIIKEGATLQDQLVHYEEVEENGKMVKKKTIGRMFYSMNEDGKYTIEGSVGSAGMKIVKESEKQSGMNAEYVEVKQQIQNLKEKKTSLVDSIKGRPMNDSELEAAMILDSQIESLEKKALDLSETGHLFEFGDRERNILSQAIINEEVLQHAEIDNLKDNEAIRGISLERYSKDQQVFGWLEDELMGQAYYNRYEEQLLTKEMLDKPEYAKLKGVYEDIVERKGKNLGVENAKNIHGIRMVDMANRFNNNIDNLNVQDLVDAGFEEKFLSPMEYSEAFSNIGVDSDNAIVKRNVIIDLGKEFETMDGWTGGRYVAVPGMGAVIGDSDIKKEWHTKAKSLASFYENDYGELRGQKTKKATQVLETLQDRVNDVGKATATYTKKKNLVDNRAKHKIYAAMDRTKLMSLPDQLNPLLEQAMVHGKSIAEWQEQGVYYDAVFDSEEQFRKRGFFNQSMLDKFGMKDEEEMKQYLRTHGATMIDDRYPNIRETSLTTARHYLMDGDLPHATNAAYTTKETMLKILGDSDGDSASRFLVEHKGVSHAQYEYTRNKIIESLGSQSFGSDNAREQYIRQKTIEAGINADTYDNFRDVDLYALTEARTVNKLYHKRVEDINWEDYIKTKQSQAVMRHDRYALAEFTEGRSILSREKLLALNYDPTFTEINDNIKAVNDTFKVLQTHIDDIEDNDLKSMISNFTNILDVEKEINVMDDALYAMENLNKKGLINDDILHNTQQAVKQRVRIGSYHSEILSKLGISAVGNVNFAFAGAIQASRNYYGAPDVKPELKARSKIMTALGYEAEQASISSKKAKLKAGDTRVLDLSEILTKIQNSNGNIGSFNKEGTLASQAMEWMQKNMNQGKVIAQYENILSKGSIPGLNLEVKKENYDAIANYMYQETIQGYADVYSNETMRKVAMAYSRVATNGANPYAIEYAQGMLKNNFLGQAAEDITGVEGTELPRPEKIGAGSSADVIDESGKKIMRQFEQNATDEAIKQISNKTRKMKQWATSDMDGSGKGKALALGVVGLASGLIAAGYASGNPLNDANPEQVAQKQTNTQMSFGPDSPQFAPNNTGGYIINIKGDTRKGNRQLKKALKQAASASVGGGVNINMSLKTSREGGYSDKDIENILSNYF